MPDFPSAKERWCTTDMQNIRIVLCGLRKRFCAYCCPLSAHEQSYHCRCRRILREFPQFQFALQILFRTVASSEQYFRRIRPERLDDHFTGLRPSAPPRKLGQQLENALSSAEVGKGETHVSDEHGCECHFREVEAFHNRLSAEEDVCLPLTHSFQEKTHVLRMEQCVSVSTKDTSLRKELFQDFFDALCSGSYLV